MADILTGSTAAPDEGAGGGLPCFKDIFNWWRLRAADDRRVSRARFVGNAVLCFRIASANDCNSHSSFCSSALISFAVGGKGGFEEFSLKDSPDTTVFQKLTTMRHTRRFKTLVQIKCEYSSADDESDQPLRINVCDNCSLFLFKRSRCLCWKKINRKINLY